MALTYVAIATIKLTSPSSAISFTSIPATYKDLVLRVTAQDTEAGLNAGYIGIKLNNTSPSSGYYRALLISDGTTSMSSASNAYPSLEACSAGNGSFFTNADLYFPDYASNIERTLPSVVTAENNTASPSTNSFNWWGSNQIYTAQIINRIDVLPSIAYAAGSRFDLYGLG
jgi:hypothetical protein